MKNVFDVTRAYTCLTADSLRQREDCFGYFCDNAYNLMCAVEGGKTNARCMYGKLLEVLDPREPKRFLVEVEGYREPMLFAVAYIFDDTCIDRSRY